MATVNMSNVNFYNPNTAPKLPHKKPAASALKHQWPLQPVDSQPLALQNDQHNDSSDDSLPLFDEMFCPYKNKNIPQMPPQNYDPLYRSKHELFDEGRLPTNLTTSNSIYLPVNTREEPLIIEDESADESEDEADGFASSDLCVGIRDQDASVCGLSTQDTVSTMSSLFGPTTPRDYQDLNDDYFSEGEPRLSVAEQNSTCPVQIQQPSPNWSELARTTDQDQVHKGFERTKIDELGSSHCDPLRERAAGSSDRVSVCDIADDIVQEPEESSPGTGANKEETQNRKRETGYEGEITLRKLRETKNKKRDMKV